MTSQIKNSGWIPLLASEVKRVLYTAQLGLAEYKWVLYGGKYKQVIVVFGE